MRTQPNAPQNSAIAVTPAISPRMAWRVAAVEALPGYRLCVRFIDGVEGLVDMSALIHSPGAGVFAALINPKHFAQAYIAYGAVTWPGEIDLAPDAMYAAIKADLEWILK